MTPKRVKLYRDPSYPDRLSLAQSALRDHQPRRWLQPALAAALAAALGAGFIGCQPKKSDPSDEPPAGPVAGQTAAGNTVKPAAGNTVSPTAGTTVEPPLPIPGVPVQNGTTTEENVPVPQK